jgi:hypothetical protein
MPLVLSRESRPDGAIVPARKQTFPDSRCLLFHLTRQRKTAVTATLYRFPSADSDKAQSGLVSHTEKTPALLRPTRDVRFGHKRRCVVQRQSPPRALADARTRFSIRTKIRPEIRPKIRPKRDLQRQDIRHRAWFARPAVFDFSHGVHAGGGHRNVARQPGLCSPV